MASPGSEIWLSSRRQLIPCCTDKTCSLSLLGMCSAAMVQSVPLLRLGARGECHRCDAPYPTHPQRRLKNGSLRPAKSAPIIYSLAVALRAVIRWVSGFLGIGGVTVSEAEKATLTETLSSDQHEKCDAVGALSTRISDKQGVDALDKAHRTGGIPLARATSITGRIEPSRRCTSPTTRASRSCPCSMVSIAVKKRAKSLRPGTARSARRPRMRFT